jgi:hypothetical protein
MTWREITHSLEMTHSFEMTTMVYIDTAQLVIPIHLIQRENIDRMFHEILLFTMVHLEPIMFTFILTIMYVFYAYKG